ncbi:MAG: hypothetical protein GY765_18655 [bacterium]|nr:hypothetical protein [bacterium]
MILKDKTKDRLIEMFCMAMVLWVCLKLTYGATHLADIIFADESASLFAGLEFRSGLWFKDGFLYFLWYKTLSFIVPDALRLYYWNYALLLAGNGILMYLVLKKLGRGKFGSAVFAILFIISSIEVFTWPYITRFALLIILSTIFTALSVKKGNTKFQVVLIGLALLVYVRTEFILALILFCLVFSTRFVYRYFKKREKGYLKLLALTLGVLVLVVFIKNPSTRHRSVWAFGQHYTLNLSLKRMTTEDPWSGNWRKVLKEHFGTDKSLFTAFYNNPGAVARHVWWNSKRTPHKILYAHYPFTLTGYSDTLKHLIKFLIIALYLAAISRFLWSTIRKFKRNNKDAHLHETTSHSETIKPGSPWASVSPPEGPPAAKDTAKGTGQKLPVPKPSPGIMSVFDFNDKLFYFYIVLLAIPSAVSILLIFPRDHYLLIFYALLFLVLVKNLPLLPYKRGTRSRSGLHIFKYLPLLLILAFIIPWRATGTAGFLPGEFIHKKSDLKRMCVLKEVNTDINIFTHRAKAWSRYKMFPRYMQSRSKYSCSAYEWKPDEMPFGDFMKKYNINAVLVSAILLKWEQLNADAAFKELLSNWKTMGWQKLDIPGGNEYLLVRPIEKKSN